MKRVWDRREGVDRTVVTGGGAGAGWLEDERWWLAAPALGHVWGAHLPLKTLKRAVWGGPAAHVCTRARCTHTPAAPPLSPPFRTKSGR